MLYMYEALRGVKGFVNDQDSGQPLPGVQLRIKGRERSFNTTAHGEYWRILLNGTYILQVPPSSRTVGSLFLVPTSESDI